MEAFVADLPDSIVVVTEVTVPRSGDR